MTRRDTQLLKGIAFLMMLIVHVWANQLDNWVIINGHLLWEYLGKVSEPVAFFLLLGGYGLYCVREKGDKHRYSRIFRLYIHYWLILFVFSSIAVLLKNPTVYPINALDVLLNYSSLHISWNPVCQFLLPYVLLSLSYPFLFKLLDRFGVVIVGIASYILYGIAGSLYGRYGDALFWEIPERFFFYLCPFMWGACLKKANAINKLSLKGSVATLLFIALLVTYSVLHSTLFTPFYVLTFVVLFVKLPRPKPIDWVLSKIGDHSMNMWFIHAWFCFILLKDELYSLKYPLIVLIAVLVMSYISSIIINIIIKPIENKLFKQ